MKALVLTTTFREGNNEVWAAGADLGCEILLCGPRDEHCSVPLEIGGVFTRALAVWPSRVRPNLIYHYYPSLPKIVSQFRPDILHINSEPWAIPAQQAANLGVPFIVHGADNIYSHGNRVERRLRRVGAKRVFQKASGFASWNSGGVLAARRFGLRPDTPTLIAPAVAPSVALFQPSGIERADVLPLRLIFVGRLVEQKGLVDLFSGIGSDAELRRHVSLSIVGDGPDRTLFEQVALERNLRVRWHGWLDGAELANTMRAHDVLVLPSRTTPSVAEQFGRVVVEAMLSGLAVVTSDSGELPNVVGDGGLTFPEGQPRELAARIRQLLDTAVLKERQRQAHQRGNSQYTPRVVAERITKFWLDCLASPASSE